MYVKNKNDWKLQIFKVKVRQKGYNRVEINKIQEIKE